MALSVLNDLGLSTLRGSPEGWPVPTELGDCLAAIGWWLSWCAVLAIWRWWRLRKQPQSTVGAALFSLGKYIGIGSLVLALALPLYVVFNVVALMLRN